MGAINSANSIYDINQLTALKTKLQNPLDADIAKVLKILGESANCQVTKDPISGKVTIKFDTALTPEQKAKLGEVLPPDAEIAADGKSITIPKPEKVTVLTEAELKKLFDVKDTFGKPKDYLAALLEQSDESDDAAETEEASALKKAIKAFLTKNTSDDWVP